MDKLYAVIGDPIAHSMSPVMHNDLFSLYKLAARYERIHIKQGQLEVGIKELCDKSMSGFNVTTPHKTDIIPLLDEVDELAAAIGAVNTVVNENGKLVGYNTDGTGYVRALREIIPSLVGKKVLVVGAGGAARAIYFSLAHAEVTDIDIANRTIAKAEDLIASCPYEVNSQPLSITTAEKLAGQYDIIIQTTSIGMSPLIDATPFQVTHVKKDTVVSDIIYNPIETRFLKEAKQKGAVIQNGLPMFVYQGALAFEKWTNIFPDTKRMERTVRAELQIDSTNK